MDYLQEGIGLRAMAQRDPLVEYKREGFDMFAAMMDAVKEESVGFLFNLDVEVDETGNATATVAPAPGHAPAIEAAAAEADEQAAEVRDDEPQLDVSMLKAAQDEHEAAGVAANGHAPAIKAKGLERNQSKQPLTYSAPDLGSDAPVVSTDDEGTGAKSGSATAKRQQARSNPNRGSRGNKGGNRNRRKR